MPTCYRFSCLFSHQTLHSKKAKILPFRHVPIKPSTVSARVQINGCWMSNNEWEALSVLSPCKSPGNLEIRPWGSASSNYIIPAQIPRSQIAFSNYFINLWLRRTNVLDFNCLSPPDKFTDTSVKNYFGLYCSLLSSSPPPRLALLHKSHLAGWWVCGNLWYSIFMNVCTFIIQKLK